MALQQDEENDSNDASSMDETGSEDS